MTSIDDSQTYAANQPPQAFERARLAFRSGDYESALVSINELIRSNPGDPVAHEFRALTLFSLGRYDEACHHLEVAQRIDPFSNRQKVARARFLHIRGRFEEGLRQLSEPLIYGPIPLEALFLFALMAAHLGKKEQALQLIGGIRAAYGAELPMMAGIAEVLALTGDMEEANRIARDLKLFSIDAPISRFRQALLAMAMGDSESALSFLTIAVADREAELIWIGVDPRLDALRSTPAFDALAHKVIPEL